MRKLMVLPGIVALVGALAACGSSSSTSGTETLTGTLAGAAAANLLNSNSNVAITLHTLVFTGPVNTSMTNTSLGNSSATTSNQTFHTPAGNFVVTHTQTNAGQQNPTITGKTGNVCHFKFSGPSGTYTVDGSQSTGQFAGATGHGNYNITFVGGSNLVSGTTCTVNNLGNVLATGAAVHFHASGPLTVKS